MTADVIHPFRTWIPFAIGTTSFLLVGGIKITGAPLHWDEGATLDAASRSIPEILHLARHLDAVISPYYVFIHFWIGLFGDSDFALRAPSLIATAFGVGIVGELGRRLISPAVGIASGLICAILPVLSFHGVQARPYGFVFFLAALSTLALFRAMHNPTWRNWGSYATCALLVGVFQITSYSLVIAHFLIVAARWRLSRDRTLLRVLPMVIGVAVLLSPFILVGIRQRGTQLNWVKRPDLSTLLKIPEDLVMNAPVGYILLVLAVAALIVVARETWLELAVLALAPIVLLLMISVLASPVWVPRYAMFVLGPFAILAAASVTTVVRRHVMLQVPVTLVLLVVLTALTLPFHASIRESQGAVDTRTMAQIMLARIEPGDGVVFGDYTLRPLLFHYLKHAGLPPEELPKDILAVKSAAEIGHFHVSECVDHVQCMNGSRRIWLATSVMVNGGSPLENAEPRMDALRSHFKVVQTWRVGPGHVTLLAEGASPSSP